MNEELEKASREYAKISTAPDKETPHWIITDFKAGAMWAIDDVKTKAQEILKTWKQRHQLYDRTAMRDAEKKVLCEYIIKDFEDLIKKLNHDKTTH